MTTAVIALAAAGAALLIVGLVWLGSARSRRASEARLTHAFNELYTRMETLSASMGEALGRVETFARRQQALDDLGSSIDLDDVLNRTAEAAAAIPGVDATVVDTTANGGTRVVASVGLSAETAQRHLVSGPPDGQTPRAVEIAYHYGQQTPEQPVIRSGIGVPLTGEEGEHVGFISVYTARGDLLGEAAIAAVEALAERATPAIENARRYREARQQADTDALTGLHNRRMFHETLAREVSRAQRYSRSLGLIVLDLDDFKEINDTYGHLAGDTVLSEVGARMQMIARTADVACRVGGEEFAIILPESSLADAEALYQRLAEAVSAKPIGVVGTVRFSAGLAELRVDDDSLSFFERADRALYEAKRSGKNQAVPDGD